jgi:hypothetical protein
MMDDRDEAQNMKHDQTGVIPDSYADTKQTLGRFQQLTWASALDAAPRPVTLGLRIVLAATFFKVGLGLWALLKRSSRVRGGIFPFLFLIVTTNAVSP